MNILYSLFAITIFLSSFLLFQIQPLISKHILPWYGGSSAVWITAMLFFMIALAIGYSYALIISRCKQLFQILIHSVLLISTLLIIKMHLALWPSAVTPTTALLPISSTLPSLSVFLTLCIVIGLPFILLSSTSSLLQLWYGTISGKEPFSLYSISNIGSLLGLVSYPLFFERYFSTHSQGEWWTYGLIAYIILSSVILFIIPFFQKKHPSKEAPKKIYSQISYRIFLRWVGLASIPVMIMLAGTSFMTIALAPIPFLWIGPLALYLVSFIITFRNGFRLPQWVNELCVVVFAISVLFTIVNQQSISILIPIFLIHITLFALYHWCHELLYELRPQTTNLPLFYVALSLGGIFGSLIIKLSNSYLFTIPIEFVIITVFAAGAILYRWTFSDTFIFKTLSQTQQRMFIGILVLSISTTTSIFIYSFEKNALIQMRNFFGYKAIVEISKPQTKIISLQHGQTNHGYQIYKDEQLQITPTAYYGTTSGVGHAISYLRNRNTNPLKIAIAGLGSGTLLAYCQPGDTFTFFEIDPDIVYLADTYFTYRKHCPQSTIILSDARLGLEKLKQESVSLYDLIIIDAYADDMVPVHLMTQEAIALYSSLVNSQGMIAIHISSRYLNLLPVIKAVSEANALSARYLYDAHPNENAVQSLWTLLLKDSKIVNQEPFLHTLSTFDSIQNKVLWTDTFSALLPIIKWK